MPDGKTPHRARILFCILGLAVLSGLYAAACASFRVVDYTLESAKFKPDTSLTIILITDLHSTIHGADQAPLLQAIRDKKPDLIVLAGDIIDDKAPVRGARLLLAGIRGLAPVYYVSGNHEYRSADAEAVWAEIRSFGARILSDEYERVTIRGNDLIIAGVEDPHKALAAPRYQPDDAMDNAFADLGAADAGAYRILLAHRPERIARYKRYPFDLVLSGHTHGGQVRIPFVLNGLYAPHQGIFPRYAGGLYAHETPNFPETPRRLRRLRRFPNLPVMRHKAVVVRLPRAALELRRLRRFPKPAGGGGI